MLASKIVSYGFAAAVAAMLVVTVIGATGALISPEEAVSTQKAGAAQTKP